MKIEEVLEGLQQKRILFIGRIQEIDDQIKAFKLILAKEQEALKKKEVEK